MNSIINHLGGTDSKGLKLMYEEFIFGGSSLIDKSWDFDSSPSIVSVSSILDLDTGFSLQAFFDIALAKKYSIGGLTNYNYFYLISKYSNQKAPVLTFNSSYTKITLYWETPQPPRIHIAFYA